MKRALKAAALAAAIMIALCACSADLPKWVSLDKQGVLTIRVAGEDFEGFMCDAASESGAVRRVMSEITEDGDYLATFVGQEKGEAQIVVTISDGFLFKRRGPST